MSTAAASEPTNTRSAPFQNIVDRNTLVWWGLILISILLAVTLTPWGCLFWLVALALDDVLLYGFGKSLLFDSQLRSPAELSMDAQYVRQHHRQRTRPRF